MIQAKKKQTPPAVIYEWPENFYKEYDAENRLEILKAHTGPDSRTDLLRRQILEKRYKTEKQGFKEVLVDCYMQAWMLMRISAEQGIGLFNRRRIVREWEGYAGTFGIKDFEAGSAEEQELQLLEWKAFFEQMLHFCLTDKIYGSLIFGAFKMSEENLSAKIAEELELLTEAFPQQLGMGDMFARFHKCAAEVYERM